ncbi:MAG: PHP domain-containing protein [Candidatus Omnitrophota bacterium]|jgi:predicted metal-dependent phosphoesterase TrpH|nr:MAG: PHP domain-containing protein [Candidatus Omnitrophota bacterium]
MKFVDLHLHSFFSDGTCSPQELVLQAKEAGVSAISVVDHDTVSAVSLVADEANKYDIEVVPGIELSADYNGSEVHILGYLIDHQAKDFLDELELLKKSRIKRIYMMLDKLNTLGVNLSPDSVFAVAGSGTISRLHIARAMLNEGFITSIQEAFQKYIGDKGPAYVSSFRLGPKEAIGLIKRVGGLAVIAHPYILASDKPILEFIEFGLDGIEIFYPEHSQSMIKHYLKLAEEYNLLATGGSDFHGSAKPEVKIGCVKIPYHIVQDMRDYKKEQGV